MYENNKKYQTDNRKIAYLKNTNDSFCQNQYFLCFLKKISNNYQKPIAAPFYEEKKYMIIIDIYK